MFVPESMKQWIDGHIWQKAEKIEKKDPRAHLCTNSILLYLVLENLTIVILPKLTQEFVKSNLIWNVLGFQTLPSFLLTKN